MNLFPPLEASNVPIVGYILTFVGTLVVGLFMGMWLQRRKEAHEVKLKGMDIQQKREEREYAENADLRKSKKEAAEVAVKKWAAHQREWEILEALYSNLSTPYWKHTGQNSSLNGHIEQLKAHFELLKSHFQKLNTFQESIKEWDLDAPDLSALYLSREPVDGEATEKDSRDLMGKVDSAYPQLRQRLLTAFMKALQSAALMQNSLSQEEEKELLNEYEANYERVIEAAGKLKEYSQIRIDICKMYCKSIQQEFLGIKPVKTGNNSVTAPK